MALIKATHPAAARREERAMNFRTRLQNPFLLVGQGFLVGAALFFALLHQSGEARSAPSPDVEMQIEAAAQR